MKCLPIQTLAGLAPWGWSNRVVSYSRKKRVGTICHPKTRPLAPISYLESESMLHSKTFLFQRCHNGPRDQSEYERQREQQANKEEAMSSMIAAFCFSQWLLFKFLITPNTRQFLLMQVRHYCFGRNRKGAKGAADTAAQNNHLRDGVIGVMRMSDSRRGRDRETHETS